MIALQTDPSHGSTSSSPLCLEVNPTAPIFILFPQRYLHSRAWPWSVFNRENTSIQARVFGFSGSKQGRLQLFRITVLDQPFSKDVSNRTADLPDQSPSTTAHIAKSFNGFIILEWGFDPVHATFCCGFLLVVKVGIVNLFTGVGWMILLSKRQLDTYLLGKLASVPSHDCGSRRHEQTNLRHILLFLLCTLNNMSFCFRLIYIILNFRVMQPYVITC